MKKPFRWIELALIAVLIEGGLAVSITAPALAAVNQITEYPLQEPNRGLCSQGGFGLEDGHDSCITAGSDGALWFAEPSVQSLGRISTGGVITEFPIHCGSVVGDICINNLIVSAADGDLYVSAGLTGIGSGFVRVSTAGTVQGFYTIPGGAPTSATRGPDGKVWFGTLSTVGVVDPLANPSVVEYALPTPGSDVKGIAAGPNNSVWFTEFANSAIGRIDVGTGIITEFRYMQPNPPFGPQFGEPRLITSAPDGTLWFNDAFSLRGTIYGIRGSSPNLGAMEAFSFPDTPVNYSPDCPVLGPGGLNCLLQDVAAPIVAGDGNLYIASELDCCGWLGGIRSLGAPPLITTVFQAGVTPVLVPTPISVSAYFLPPSSSLAVPSDLTVGPDGNLWYTAGRCVPCGTTGGQDTHGNLIGVLGLTPSDTDLALTGVPPNITTNATSPSGAVVTYTPPTAVDEEPPSPVSCDHPSGSTFPIGTTTVTCSTSSADDTPSTVSASFTVTVADTDLALTGVPPNITTNATSPSGAVVTYTPPTAVDEELPSPVSCDHASGSTFPIGTTTVTCSTSSADDTPSTVSASFTVTVADTDLALTGVPTNITINATSQSGAVVTYTPPTAIDEAGDIPAATVSCVPASGSTFAIGTTTVNCSANSADDTPSIVSQSFTVTVVTAQDLNLTLASLGGLSRSRISAYFAVVTNTGTAATSGTLIFTDTLPAGLTYVGTFSFGWNCGVVGQKVTCKYNQSVGVQRSTFIVLLVRVSAPVGTVITNAGMVTPLDATPADNKASVQVTVRR